MNTVYAYAIEQGSQGTTTVVGAGRITGNGKAAADLATRRLDLEGVDHLAKWLTVASAGAKRVDYLVDQVDRAIPLQLPALTEI